MAGPERSCLLCRSTKEMEGNRYSRRRREELRRRRLRRARRRRLAVCVAGDLCLEEDGFVIDKYDEVDDLGACISPEILELTGNADIFYLNHEYTVSDRGEALAGKLYTFRAKPERMALLEEMGTDLVSLANNHIYDYGEEGMLDTLDYLDKAGIPYVGGGRNIKEAGRPVYFIINGMKIGFVAASNAELTLYTPAAGEDTPGILEAYDTSLYDQVIAEASKECDYLIAYIHWGPEDVNQYAAYQTAQGKEFLDAGADIVVGGHPHVLQGMEYMDGKPVIYSMGDFWFNGETKYTGLLNLEISVDGGEPVTVDTYSAVREDQAVLFDTGELAPGTHTVLLRVLGEKSAGSTGCWIEFDAVQLLDSAGNDPKMDTAVWNEDDARVSRFSIWTHQSVEGCYHGDDLSSSTWKAHVEFTFTGTNAVLRGLKAPWCGTADISVDGTVAATVDTYAPELQSQAVWYDTGELPFGTHTIRITVNGAKSSASQGRWVEWDTVTWR